ncbi:thioredoxin-dependent peroxide reductase, mitochondrial-like [Carcharodon carcharias]|uniref:thioredoxin-dependent peroxide reductase, mitochondrial-like n=1 Tax=Carcharodon carcharias TaxID=13397 RepID=UPI001B7E2886|nr:thioredoxin-dependent peroxide reductase, mitochondrial-like [Carcharodon carcharias]
MAAVVVARLRTGGAFCSFLYRACLRTRQVPEALRLHCLQKNAANWRISTSLINHKRTFSTTYSNFTPAVTQSAPFFKGTAVVNGEFKEINLDDYKGKYLVVFFYPLDFTFVCPTEIVAFSNKASEFHDVNCEVIGVSVDSHFSHLAWINMPRKSGGLGHMNIPLLSDLTKQISRDYGVLMENSGIALRGLFIIDTNGIIKHISINDLPVGRSAEETLRLVKAFQFVETHGEVCPAEWTPESPTIKPSPEGSKEYFANVKE